jgi:hypothetical protein
MCWGVGVLQLAEYGGTLSSMSAGEHLAIDHGLVASGDLLVFIGGLGSPAFGASGGQTNVLTVQIAGASGSPGSSSAGGAEGGQS